VAVAAGVVVAVTLALYPLSKLDPGVSSGVLYVLGVLLVATYWGLWLGVATSVASALALAYFRADPAGTFVVKNSADVAAITVMFLTAIVASVIADRARARAEDEAERMRLREVHASRARVLEAADQERRRVVRDLHDGAQQGLVHTVVTLKLASRALAHGDPSGPALVEEAVVHAERATSDLRELARGILPSALVNNGLRVAVEGVAARTGIPVDVKIGGNRYPPAVEATAYFVIVEALTNVAKHARSHAAAVTVSQVDGDLVVQVRDDGAGGARTTGTGLLGLSDRLAVLGGHLRVDSPPGGGTTIVATIPRVAADPRTLSRASAAGT
jgi:signal transduction histidine kinase